MIAAEGWAVAQLKDVCELVNGRAYKQEELLEAGKYPVLRVGNFFSNLKWYYSDLELESAKYCVRGDLLYAWSASFGPKVWQGDKAIFHYHIWRVELDARAVDQSFIFNWFVWDKENIKAEHGTGSTMIHVTKGDMEERLVAIPPLAEQRRIVTKLDALTARTARARVDLDRIPTLATRHKQAVLAVAMSGELTASWRESRGQGEWTLTTLKTSFSVTTGSTPPKARTDCYGGTVPFVKPGDLDSGEAITRTTVGLTEAGFSVARQLPPGTVLVSCIGNLGKVGILGSAGSCNQQINAILPSPKALPKFLYYWAQTLKDWLEESSSATTIAIVNKSRFEAAEINLPPFDEQAEIVRRIDATFAEIDRLAAEAVAARRLLDRLDQAILAKAFRGELVAQDPADEPASVLLERIRAERAAAPKAKRARPRRLGNNEAEAA